MSFSSSLAALRAGMFLLVASLSTVCAIAHAEPAPASPSKSVEHPGCFLLMELKSGKVTRIHPELCSKRLPPASTFKVPHALIALETGVLSGPEEVRRWDGTRYDIQAWNQDQTLDTAMRRSALWFFQGTAKQIGRERMTDWLGRLRYGNQDTSGELTQFWLNGTLRITPEEQLDFMARLYRNELPVSERSREIVKRTLAQGPDTVANTRSGIALYGPWKDGAVLSAKTGFARLESEGDVTWLVGHVQTPRGAYVFVSSVATPTRQQEPPAALVSGIAALKDLGVL
ncbi:penicillin-binding transpeptidase domain-containing protein [Hyalangium versicolor]|uniref:penicillin-binding transpeptidase domain-containing protein n=1 Tax=Hyalangium versicolor TaxID=2861190 RepID=UPI001CCF2A3B|nr:penicillin-binding transpeptidase domain-containing protein [Hyalangium versicolor]